MSDHLDHHTQSELALSAQRGDPQAQARLLDTNQALIAHWARRYRDRGVEFEELMQEGQIGMIKAIQKFDPAKGARFATYATLWIKQAMGRTCEGQGSLERFGMRLPSEVCSAFLRLDDLEDQSFAAEQARRMSQLGRPASLQEEPPEGHIAPQLDSPALARMVLAQGCGHIRLGFGPDRVADYGGKLADRVWAGRLQGEDWWAIIREKGRSWKLEIATRGALHPLPEGVGMLSDCSTDRLLPLCDLLPLIPADSCPYCR